MIAEAVLVDTSQAQVQLQQQHQQQQMQQQMQQQQQHMQTESAMPSMAQTNGSTRTAGRISSRSGDGCCDNVGDRAKAAVEKVAPCACKFILLHTILS